MQTQKEHNVITLSKHPAFTKNELVAEKKKQRSSRETSIDFIENLFRFLGEKRGMVFRFIRMKLDRQRRVSFAEELDQCRNLTEESRCVKKYIGHLKVNDVSALFMSLPEILPGRIEAFVCFLDSSDENRLTKLQKTFGQPDGNSIFCKFSSK